MYRWYNDAYECYWFGVYVFDPPVNRGETTATLVLSFNAGQLEPSRNIGWRLYGDGVSTFGGWHRMTESPIPVEPTTWGRVKAMYK